MGVKHVLQYFYDPCVRIKLFFARLLGPMHEDRTYICRTFGPMYGDNTFVCYVYYYFVLCLPPDDVQHELQR